ncbi:transient receptor potential cation channel subfamily V member 6-like [Saccoglossus kowalevskii]|uniref:Transient receptor potential cation channel subfamily V member 6-like n=1 Tax=Saccoglossus kowalevskii TaxID=10224 RepID=A0ABM0M7L5_SACKO|nr:PREDICTED: transient receptor potential cation channel subfamily V member 6-like [Saccoglossus kowalevskii]
MSKEDAAEAATAVGGGVDTQTDETSAKLYDLVNLKGGGSLVDLMREARRSDDYSKLDEAIKREVPKYLYNDGDGEYIPISQLVTRRNKERQTNKVKKKKRRRGQISNSVSMLTLVDHNGDSGRRLACWHIDKRGTVGETILHLCLLQGSKIHNELAQRLVNEFPKLVYDIYIGEEYYGEWTCVLIAALLIYWGEYPLSFAACLEQEEIFKILREAGADPKRKDNNGNTVLHMMVIHNKKNMYDLAFSMGADTSLLNSQELTALNLAAKLGRKEMFDHALELERQVYWIYGNVTCAAYGLSGLDSIDKIGNINEKSILHLVVNQEGMEHLDMMDGLIVYILREKWKSYARYRFLRRAAFFLLYLLLVTIAFYLRPGADLNPTIIEVNTTVNGNYEMVNQTIYDDCYLQNINGTMNIARLVFEVLSLIGALTFIIYFLKEIYYQGMRNFLWTLRSAPAKTIFLVSLFFLFLSIPGRIWCVPIYEDTMFILAMLTTCPYFLFFLRPFKLVGPFVVMIYKMIKGDLLKFTAIYVVFLIGFSQAMYLVFIGTPNSLFTDPANSILGMFIMSLGEFADIYESFDDTRHPNMGKFLFVLYMVLVTLLLINMLIAMMGNTYTTVAETRKEWLRQWARIVLVIEQAVSPGKRIKMQMQYSQPTSKEGERAILMRWHHTKDDEVEQKKIRELHDKHTDPNKFPVRDSSWQDSEDHDLTATSVIKSP